MLRPTLLVVLLIAVGAAYSDSLHGPFVFDDTASIVQNPSVRRLWPLPHVLFPPPGGETVAGRPIVNLSIALNYVTGGIDPFGYHVFNLLIHACACLVLFGVVRRTLERTWPGRDAAWMAFGAALCWGVHPLQTEAVTYVIQRAESLMALFYLLTLYGFIRACGDADGVRTAAGGDPCPAAPARHFRRWPRERRLRLWSAVSFIACVCGMATKEVMVSAPVIVLLYDRTFVAGSFREALRRRWRMHAALASTWILLAALVISDHGRGATAGFETWMPAHLYWLTQPPAIVQYLELAFWPHPLVFDYGLQRHWTLHPAAAIPYAALVAALAAGTAWALWRRPRLGFLGLWFFAILAPTSVMPGTRQSMADHRMYLALAPIAALTAWALYRVCRARLAVFVPILCVAAASCGAATWERNRDYSDELRLWAATARDAPDNYYAWHSLGTELGRRNRLDEAQAAYERALQVFPDDAEARSNLAWLLVLKGHPDEALAQAERAERDWPTDASVRLMVADVYAHTGRMREALHDFAVATRLDPSYPQAQYDWGNALILAGDPKDAAEHLDAAARLQPLDPQTWNNLGTALSDIGRTQEAIRHYETAIKLNPAYYAAYYNLGLAYRQVGNPRAAARQFAAAARLDPASPGAHFNYGECLAALGETARARGEFQAVLRLHPGDASALAALRALSPNP